MTSLIIILEIINEAKFFENVIRGTKAKAHLVARGNFVLSKLENFRPP